MKERWKGRKKERRKRKEEKNRGAIGNASLDLRQSDDQNSLEQEANFIYATRASCRYQDLEFLSNSKR